MASKLRLIFNLVASVGTTAQKSRKGEKIEYEETPLGVAARFLRSQLSPAASLVPDAVTGETFDKRKFNWTDAMISRVTPFIVQDVYAGFVEGGGAGGAVKALPSFLGVGVRTRDQAKMKREFAEAREASKVAEARAKITVSVASAPEPVRTEVKRLGLVIPALPKNIVVEGLTGDSVKAHTKGGEQLAGMSDEEYEKMKRAYADEAVALIGDEVSNPDYASFESDADRMTYLKYRLGEHRKLFLNGVRLGLRERHGDELKKLEDYQRTLEGRSKQMKPGVRMKL
ncbi:MAG: hypothetical protein H0X14_11835 [Acidobacteria bacterium]|nr:hypothetical protein [Acidobacteriota bacterium]